MHKGITRRVFFLGKYAVKVPHGAQRHFLSGCLANLLERKYTKEKLFDGINPSLYCAWMGLFSVQRKAFPLERHLTKKEKERFMYLTSDLKKENFGLIDDKLVCIDYG